MCPDLTLLAHVVFFFEKIVLFTLGMFRLGKYILQGLLRIVMGVLSRYTPPHLFVFEGRYEPYYWLSEMLLPGPR